MATRGHLFLPPPLSRLDFAPRVVPSAPHSRRSRLSERDFSARPAGAASRCHRPSSDPPRAPRPSPPLLSTLAPGWPRGGAVPGCHTDSCGSHYILPPVADQAPGPHGAFPPTGKDRDTRIPLQLLLPRFALSQGKATRPAAWG